MCLTVRYHFLSAGSVSNFLLPTIINKEKGLIIKLKKQIAVRRDCKYYPNGPVYLKWPSDGILDNLFHMI